MARMPEASHAVKKAQKARYSDLDIRPLRPHGNLLKISMKPVFFSIDLYV
jgi:hypothetical protein